MCYYRDTANDSNKDRNFNTIIDATFIDVTIPIMCRYHSDRYIFGNQLKTYLLISHSFPRQPIN